MKRMAAVGVVMMVLALSAGKCPRTQVTNAPPGVNPSEVASWYEATGYLAFTSEVVKEATVATQKLRQDGILKQEIALPMLTAFGRMAQVELTASAWLKTLPQHFDQPAAARFRSYYASLSKEFQAAAAADTAGLPAQHAQVIANFMAKIDGVLRAVEAFLSKYGLSIAHVPVGYGGGWGRTEFAAKRTITLPTAWAVFSRMRPMLEMRAHA